MNLTGLIDRLPEPLRERLATSDDDTGRAVNDPEEAEIPPPNLDPGETTADEWRPLETEASEESEELSTRLRKILLGVSLGSAAVAVLAAVVRQLLGRKGDDEESETLGEELAEEAETELDEAVDELDETVDELDETVDEVDEMVDELADDEEPDTTDIGGKATTTVELGETGGEGEADETVDDSEDEDTDPEKPPLEEGAKAILGFGFLLVVEVIRDRLASDTSEN